MNYLVDTHVFLWVAISPKKISKKVKDILLDLDATIWVSLVSFWETSLKYQLGKLNLAGILPDKLPAIAKGTGFEILNLDPEIASSFYRLPRLKNKDPFDRMLAWQAISKDYSLITRDTDFTDYKDHGLKIVW